MSYPGNGKSCNRSGDYGKCKIDSIDSQLRADVEDAVNFAKTSSFPEGNMLMEHIYA